MVNYSLFVFGNYWCPSGCGKSVFYNSEVKAYVCKRCNGVFSKEEVNGV